MHDPTVSSARGAVTLCRGVAFDRIALAAAVVMPLGITMCSGLAVGAFFGVIALPFVALGLRNVLRQPPLLRGDGRGLWFGRGRIETTQGPVSLWKHRHGGRDAATCAVVQAPARCRDRGAPVA